MAGFPIFDGPVLKIFMAYTINGDLSVPAPRNPDHYQLYNQIDDQAGAQRSLLLKLLKQVLIKDIKSGEHANRLRSSGVLAILTGESTDVAQVEVDVLQGAGAALTSFASQMQAAAQTAASQPVAKPVATATLPKSATTYDLDLLASALASMQAGESILNVTMIDKQQQDMFEAALKTKDFGLIRNALAVCFSVDQQVKFVEANDILKINLN
jgi:hypothetical protein